jgi:4-hydroxy-tetrahydrodipicolinate synthase
VGPIVVVATPFKADASVDYDGVREMVRRAKLHGATVFALTSGDSLYSELSIEEVKTLTRVLAEAAGADGIVIACSGDWSKDDVLDYARFAEEVGADALQVLKPPKMTDDDEVVAYFREVAQATRLGIVLHGNFSEELLGKLVSIESIVSMKEDVGLEYLMDRLLVFGDRLAIFPGGAESRFIVGWPFGARAYYSGFYQFAPALGEQFWNAMQQQDLRAAAAFVKKYDFPYMRAWNPAFWRASMAYFGVSERYIRPIEKSYTEQQMKEVAQFWSDLGVFPEGQTDEINRTRSDVTHNHDAEE